MLTDTKLKNSKAREKEYQLTDGRGLSILVKPNGSKLWRFRYQWSGKPKMISCGSYPAVSLKAAREQREKYKEQQALGIDPLAARQEENARQRFAEQNTFRAIADLYVADLKKAGRAPRTIQKQHTLLTVLLPQLGDQPINNITSADVLKPLRDCFDRGHKVMAVEARSLASAIFAQAIGMGLIENDPSQPLSRLPLFKNVRRGKQPGITDPEELGSLLFRLEDATHKRISAVCLLILAHTFVRPSELREATWEEIDLVQRLWTIPASRMKMRKSHLVPLTDQTLALFQKLKDYAQDSPLVCPSPRFNGKPMSDGTFLKALRDLGYNGKIHVPHGFRTSASTLLNENAKDWGLTPDYIERQLAHTSGTVRGAYNEAEWLSERIRMMKIWSDYLSSIQEENKSS